MLRRYFEMFIFLIVVIFFISLAVEAKPSREVVISERAQIVSEILCPLKTGFHLR